MAQTTIQGSFLDSTLDITGLVLSGASPLVFEGASADAHETTLAFVDPTADRTITFPNTTGTIALTSDLTSYITISSTDTLLWPSGPTPIGASFKYPLSLIQFISSSSCFLPLALFRLILW